MKKLIILLFTTTLLFSQEKKHSVLHDSLKNIGFEELERRIDNPAVDLKTRKTYAKIYYNKAKRLGDDMKIANAMYLNALVSEDESTTLKYADSIIALTKDSGDFQYPAKGYILKGNLFLTNFRLKEALENILEAEKYSKKTKNIEQNLLVNRYIGLIKIELGKPQEALPLFLESHNFLKTKKSNYLDLLFVEWVLSDIYIRLDKVDTALEYIDNALQRPKEENPYYIYFEMYKGICCHLKKDFAQSNVFIDKSIHSIGLINDPLNLAVCYYYKGENILQNEKNPVKARVYFEKVDEILLKAKKNSRDLRDNYIRLIEITKNQKDDKKQLYYLNRLIEIDNYFEKNNIVLSESINKNYDTPRLFAEKEKLISKIRQEKYLFIGFGCLLFVVLGFSMFSLFKTKKENRLFEERFKQLMQKPITEEKPIEKEIIETTEIKEIKTKTIDLPIEIATEILKKLSQFENDKGYLQQNIKQTDFAKQLDSNSSYLSKTINHYKGKNFSQYLNDLRIDFAVKKIRSDKKFRKYTIKAISEEVGFSNPESFSKAFYSKTGLQPSYFIKKIEENNPN